MTPENRAFQYSADPRIVFSQGLQYPSVSYVYPPNPNEACGIYPPQNSVLFRPNNPQNVYLPQQSQQPQRFPLIQGYLENQVSSPVYPVPCRKTGSLPHPPLAGVASPVYNQSEYLRELSLQRGQQVGGPIERPWWMWCIGWVDIISAVFNLVLVVYHILFKPISDPENYIWRFFIGFLAIVARLLQGLGILVGLRSKDDSNTLWYCKLWFFCQILFVIVSVLELLYYGITYGAGTSREQQDPTKLAEVTVLCVYRLTSFIMVKVYINRLKVSVDRVLGGAQWRERMQEESEENQRIGESSFCGPTIALIMSL